MNILAKIHCINITKKNVLRFIKDYLGFITIFISVITFWVIQYNNYIKISNEIKIENENNLKITESIGKDLNDKWLYLIKFSNFIYKENWNYITQYYDNECIDKFRNTSLNMDSANTLINMKISGIYDENNQKTLKELNNRISSTLQEILKICPVKQWKLIYKNY